MVESNDRPDPDDLLKSIQAESHSSGRGNLKIFFGACAGVGKTYAMLEAARERMREGVDVLAGIVETHGRPETEILLKNIPLLSPLAIEYQGISLREFDLDSALQRKPSLILVDELAHTNAPTCRHPKRWMDIQELLDAGIDVYTTLNVQHLESFNDIVAGITGIHVKETVPDSVLDMANDVTLVDLPSDDLIERLREGKVYISDIGKKQAIDHFFRLENLTALREMALRRTAEWVDAEYSSYVPSHLATAPKILDRVAVCVGAANFSTRIIRSAKLLSTSLKAPWVGVYVENERHYKLSKEEHLSVDRHLMMVEQLGGKTKILHGNNAAESIISYAKRNKITKIVVGRGEKSRWQEFWRGSLVIDLIRLSGDIDIYVISEKETASKEPIAQPPVREETDFGNELLAFIFPALITFFGLAGDYLVDTLWPSLSSLNLFSSFNMMIIFLGGIALAAVRLGLKSVWISSLMSAIFILLFFLPGINHPAAEFLDFHVTSRSIFTLMIFLTISFIIGKVTSTIQKQRQYLETKTHNIGALYAMSKKLSSVKSKKGVIHVIQQHLESTFEGRVKIWLKSRNAATQNISKASPLVLITSPMHSQEEADVKESSDPKEESAVRWAYEKKQRAGKGTNTLPSARGYYIPLGGTTDIHGVLGLILNQSSQELTSEELHILETFVDLASPVLERVLKVDNIRN